MRHLLLACAAAVTCVPRAAEAQGVIAGTVRDASGARLAGVHVAIRRDTIARGLVTAADGIFLVQGLAQGQYVLVARKPGYLAAEARVDVPRDSAVMVEITLIGEAQRLPGVVVEATVSNRVHGTTVDRNGKPVEGVTVEMIGQRRRDTTDAQGVFAFNDLDIGLYLMQFRKQGFSVAQTGVHMERTTDLQYAVEMLPLEKNRYTPELAAMVAHEAQRRLGMAGGRSAIVGRDELARFGRTRLLDALPASSGAIAYWSAGPACVLIDGHEDASSGIGPSSSGRGRQGRGPRSILGAVGRAPPPDRAAAGPISWLQHFRADEVEMVEIYPEGSENSRTLCGRFPPSSGCSCPPEPAGIVIWLR